MTFVWIKNFNLSASSVLLFDPVLGSVILTLPLFALYFILFLLIFFMMISLHVGMTKAVILWLQSIAGLTMFPMLLQIITLVTQ